MLSADDIITFGLERLSVRNPHCLLRSMRPLGADALKRSLFHAQTGLSAAGLSKVMEKFCENSRTVNGVPSRALPQV